MTQFELAGALEKMDIRANEGADALYKLEIGRASCRERV